MSSRVGLNKAVLNKAVGVAVFLWALQSAVPASALGLGEMEMRSFLNEPLDAEVELLDLRGLEADDIRIRLAANDDFERLGVERSYFLTAIQFVVDVDESTGRGVIRLSTEDPVLEPYLDLIIEARWPTGRLLREYTVLVDPPAFRQEVVTVSASEQVAKTEPSPPTAPAPTPSETAAAGRPSDGLSTRRSDLPPGEMPDRPFSAATSGDPSPGNRYMVKRDETLWQIASSGRPGGVSVQQAMLDIQRLNPEAFIGGNINRIKAGYIIYLPAAGEISSDDLARALDEVREQNQAFASGRAQPGVTAAATLRVSAEPLEDSVAAAANEAAASADAGSGGAGNAARGGGSDASMDASRDTPSEASPDGDNVASAQLAAQLNAMAERLDTLEQIVALKDQQIATLEQALRESREASALVADQAMAEDEDGVTLADLSADMEVEGPADSSDGMPAEMVDAAADVAGATMEDVESVTAEPPAAPTQPAAEEPRGLMSSLPIWPLVAGVLAIFGMLAFFVTRRRRQSDTVGVPAGLGRDLNDDVFAGVSLKKEALEPEDEDLDAEVGEIDPLLDLDDDIEDERDVDDDNSAPRGTGSRGYGERKHDDYIDEGASGDALAEADIYIAYGRYLQAIELLNTAIEEEPENSAYRLKLIELYVDMGEDDEAERQLDRLRALGDDDAIARAENLVGGAGTGVDDFAAQGAHDLAEDDFDDAQSLEDDELEGETLELDEAALDELSDDEAEDLAGELADDLAESDGEDGDAEGDAEVDAGTEGEEEDDDAAELPLDSVTEDDILDFTAEAPVARRSPELDVDTSMEPIEFEHLQIEEDVGPRSDLDMDIEADDELDLSEALVDAANEPEEESTGDGEATGNGNGDGNGDEELVIAEDADQMATKLDLARAYLDMGDSDGAKVILEQVLGAGTEEQQQEARDLISRID